MIRDTRLAALAACVLAFSLTTTAQQPAAADKNKKSKPSTTRAVAAAEADPLAEIRRASATSLVTSLAEESRMFRDQSLRARVQARAADALWESDQARARTLLRRAWEAAESADQENARLAQEARRNNVRRNFPNLRSEVLRLAARRDRELGEEFLAKLDESRKQQESATANSADAVAAANAAASSGGQSTPRINPDDPPPTMTQRLGVARQLLDDGEAERAAQFADAALYPVNVYGENFLEKLRAVNPEAADARYTALLARAAADPVSDANTISLLSSYVFTPNLYLTFGADGGGHTRQWAEKIAPPENFPAQLRTAFLRAAAQVLLRPVPPPDQDKTTSGRGGTYVVTARMATLSEQHAPDLAPALRARLALLQQDVKKGVRDPAENRALTAGIVPEDETRDRVQDILDQVEKADSPESRDEGYAHAAFAALRANQDTARARELTDKISDLDLRKTVRSFVDFAAVAEAARRKDAGETLRLARTGELSAYHRAWGLTEAARLLPKEEAGRAVEILEEAMREAKRVDATSPERVRAHVAVVTQLAELDRGRAWEMMSEVVKAANAAPEFTGEDGELTVRVQFKRGATTMNFSAETFNLSGVFAALARDNFDRAADLAKTLTSEHARAFATLAVARTALGDKRREQRSER